MFLLVILFRQYLFLLCIFLPMYFYNDKNNKYITYVLIYSKDDGIHGIGSHKSDIEFVRVFFDENDNIIRYYLSEHGRDSGLYCNEKCIKDNYE